MDKFMRAAVDQAEMGLQEGGIPIGAALVLGGEVVALGHNRRVQERNRVLHAEIDCFRNAGLEVGVRGATLYSTLMPCYFCAGAAVQFGIAKVVAGESVTFSGGRDLLEAHGIEVSDLGLSTCVSMMTAFIEQNRELWHRDIGADDHAG
jgi:cytosine deaminase